MQYTKILSIVFLCSFFAYPAFAQQNTNISGEVLDQNDTPIPGVLIRISPIAKGLVTDENGKFSLSVPSNQKYILEFFFLGYKDHKEDFCLGSFAKNMRPTLDEHDSVLAAVTVTGKPEISEIKKK